jgi:hypothetical protein
MMKLIPLRELTGLKTIEIIRVVLERRLQGQVILVGELRAAPALNRLISALQRPEAQPAAVRR